MPTPLDSPVTTALRRGLCHPTDTMLGMFLRTGLHMAALKAPHGDRSVEALTARLGRRLIIPFLSYGMAGFLDILHVLEGFVGPDEAAALVARKSLDPFFGSPVGNVLFSLARATPHDLIEAAVHGYTTCLNRGTRTYTRVGDREATMRFEDDLLGPAWHALGIFPTAVQKVCGVDATVTVEDMDEARSNFTLRTRW